MPVFEHWAFALARLTPEPHDERYSSVSIKWEDTEEKKEDIWDLRSKIPYISKKQRKEMEPRERRKA